MEAASYNMNCPSKCPEESRFLWDEPLVYFKKYNATGRHVVTGVHGGV
jgi:hypothetical protein